MYNRNAVSVFMHHLHDTVVLLGGGTEIGAMLDRWEELTNEDVERLRNINCHLMTLAKDRLANIHKMTIDVGGED